MTHQVGDLRVGYEFSESEYEKSRKGFGIGRLLDRLTKLVI